MTRPATPRNTPGIVGGIFGAAFGFLLAAANLHEYDTIHAMLRLEEPDVFLLMASAIGVSAPLLWWLEKRRVRSIYGGTVTLSRSRPERHHLVGGALFGTGWALAGTCPAPALVMVSSGALLGLVAITGLFTGLWLRDRQLRVPAHLTPAGDGDGEHRVIQPTASG